MRVNSILRLGSLNFVTFFLRISFILSGGALPPSLASRSWTASTCHPAFSRPCQGKMGGKLGSYQELCSIDLLDVLRSPRPQGAGRPWLPDHTPADPGRLGQVLSFDFARAPFPRPTGGPSVNASSCNAKVFLLKSWPERNVCPQKGFTPSLPEWTDRHRIPISTVSIRGLPGVKPSDLSVTRRKFSSALSIQSVFCLPR